MIIIRAAALLSLLMLAGCADFVDAAASFTE